MDLKKLTVEELARLISPGSDVHNELRRRNVLRTKNTTGELGEYFAVEYFNNTPKLPTLILPPPGVQNVDAFKATMQSDYVVVDVRTPEEFANGALPKAINISVTSLDFPFEINKLDKEKPVMIYCKAGSRSARAAVAMKALGFNTIYELEGGYTAWQVAKN